MTSNPTDGIRLMQFDEVTKAILSLKEIQKLAITPCPNNEVKRAFLFSCYCGLKDACLLYFQTFSGMPIPAGIERPVHELEDMKRFRLEISNYECPESGFNK